MAIDDPVPSISRNKLIDDDLLHIFMSIKILIKDSRISLESREYLGGKSVF